MMTSQQVLCALFNWPAMEERARSACLHPRLQCRNGALLLKVLLLAFLNGARVKPLKKRELKDEIAKAYRVAPEMVDDRIKDLEAIGYLTTTPSADPRVVIIVATEKARADLWRYGRELIKITRTLNHQLVAYGPLAPEEMLNPTEIDIVRDLAHLSAMEIDYAYA